MRQNPRYPRKHGRAKGVRHLGALSTMENTKIIECSIMEEVREMRRKISAEFGHDFNQLVAYYQALENEMRKSGKYKFVDPPRGNSGPAGVTG